ncbi:Protein-tyrosine sulfotransferase [Linum perenne]
MLSPLANIFADEDGFGRCETAVKMWSSSALGQENKEDKHTLRDLLFFLHVPRTGGRAYFHCFLKKLYSIGDECPRSYDILRFDPRKQRCRLMVTHDDYSMMSKLPEERTSMVTILRNPVDRVFSTYEFSIEVAARFMVHSNLTMAVRKPPRSKKNGMISTLNIWPWKFLVPWMREELFARREARKRTGLDTPTSNNPYSMPEFSMPLLDYINDPIAHDIVHNGATFQVAGITNNSYYPEAYEVRHCVGKYKVLGDYILQVAKKRLDDMLYVGLTEDHKESATMFANVVASQVISQTLASVSSTKGNERSAPEHSTLSSDLEADHEDHQTNTSAPSTETSDNEEHMTVEKLMDRYGKCTNFLRKTQSNRRTFSLKQIAPANFSNEDRGKVSDVILDEIRSLNSLDIELYKYAQSLFAKQHESSLQRYGMAEGLGGGLGGSILSSSSSVDGIIWDFCFYKGSVVEHLDGHTDIVHKQLYNDWLSWGMKRRDFLLRRYWRREDDGTYVILYHSVFHKKCPPQKGYVRACLKSGGYVISPLSQGKRSVVKHMLAVDWKLWRSYIRTSSARTITTRMLGRVVALRELFRAKLGACSAPDFSLGELAGSALNRAVVDVETYDAQAETDEDVKAIMCQNEEADKAPSEHASIGGLNGAADEFFDVPEPSDNECWSYDFGSEACSQDLRQPKLSSAAVFVKKLHDLADASCAKMTMFRASVQKRGYVDLHDMSREDNTSCGGYGTTIPKDESCSLLSSWAMTDPSTFLIRGKTICKTKRSQLASILYVIFQIKAKGTLMQMVAADWLKSDKREDDLAGLHGSIVQKYAAQGGPEFFLIINIQVPGSTTYSLALYFMMNTPLEDSPLLQSFVDGDDAFRNSWFKLIPYISKGSWIVKQSVGKKACLIGQALEMNYFRGNNYLELGVDLGSSIVARAVVSLVLGYLSNLVIEMAFLVQADTDEELPEYLLGTCRLNHLDASKAVSLKQ